MPAKNTNDYISDAIDALIDANWDSWELIVIDDHSDDKTLDILEEYQKCDSRIKVFGNIGSGKVDALNYGYSKTCGDYIKCIDADDVLDKVFFSHLNLLTKNDTFCHDMYITNEILTVIGTYSLDPTFFQNDFDYCLRRLKGVPRCSWTFSRNLGNKIFPMPAGLPFEDTWFSLIIKKHSRNICHLNEKLYYYRQHNNQAYGGILNFKKDTIVFRAKRNLELIKTMKNEPSNRLVSSTDNEDIFRESELFNTLLAKDDLRITDIIKADLPLSFKLKLMIYRKLGFIASLAVRLKWKIDRLKRNR